MIRPKVGCGLMRTARNIAASFIDNSFNHSVRPAAKKTYASRRCNQAGSNQKPFPCNAGGKFSLLHHVHLLSFNGAIPPLSRFPILVSDFVLRRTVPPSSTKAALSFF